MIQLRVFVEDLYDSAQALVRPKYHVGIELQEQIKAVLLVHKGLVQPIVGLLVGQVLEDDVLPTRIGLLRQGLPEG
jgi:hypothetical protein